MAKDETESASWYQKAAELGVEEAQYKLGVCYEHEKRVVKIVQKIDEP